jgi:uncharacterized protein with HEPN domain
MQRDRVVVDKIISYASECISFCEDMDYDQFCLDGKTKAAVAFNLQQMGDLVKKLDQHIVDKSPYVPWAQIKGMRNRIVHDYQGIRLEIVWQVVRNDLAGLITALDRFIQEYLI